MVHEETPHAPGAITNPKAYADPTRKSAAGCLFSDFPLADSKLYRPGDICSNTPASVGFSQGAVAANETCDFAAFRQADPQICRRLPVLRYRCGSDGLWYYDDATLTTDAAGNLP